MSRCHITLATLLIASAAHAAETELVFQDAKVEAQPARDDTAKPKLSTPETDRKSHASFDVYADHAFAASFTDTGGELSVTRAGVGFQMVFPVLSDSQIGVALGAERWDFDFKDAAAFDAADGDPWSGVNNLNLAVTFSNQINEHWSYVAGAFGRSGFASGADISESLSGGFILGGTYKFSDTLSIGGGLSIRSPLEDDWSVLPLVTVDWKIGERLALRSTPSVGRRMIALTYTPIDSLELSLGGGIESIDFRLDSDAPAPNGVGRFRRVPVGIDVTYNFSKQVSVNLYGGLLFSQELTLDDSHGNRIEREQLDSSAFFGGGFQWRF